MFKFTGFTEKANRALNKAVQAAESMGHTYIGSEHLLLGLLSDKTTVAGAVLAARHIQYDNIENYIKQAVGVGVPTELVPDDFTPRSKRIIETAVQLARGMGQALVGTEHVLLAIVREPDCMAAQMLAQSGVSLQEIVNDVSKSIMGGTAAPVKNGEEASDGTTLSQFGRDLTKLAKEGKIDPVIGRQKEIERVIQILSRRTKNNPCLIGEPGVGKTAIAEGLALKIVSGEVPEMLKNKRIISLDLTGMVAGTKYRGDFEERIKKVIDEVKAADDIILFIDEVHTLVGAGSAEGAVDAANILKPSLARGELQVIGATTLEEYRKNIEKDAALERRFQPIIVGEPSEEEAIEILKGLRDKYEAHHKVKITDEAINAAVKLSSRYIGDRYLPDKAIDLIDEAASRVKLQTFTAPPELKTLEEQKKEIEAEKQSAVNAQEFERAAELRDREKQISAELEEKQAAWKKQTGKSRDEVGEAEVAQIVASWTGIPITQLTTEESERLLHLEDELHRRIVGQDEAVKAVSRAIRRGRVGLKDPKKPVGSFIFLGPTGVGKTELCKALAAAMFGDENAMIRLDMSEYMEKHTVSRLVGSPPGYVGYEEGGQLTEQVRRKPYSVILLDEIEKAHPDVFNMLLQILDDGILTDSQGRHVDFKNCIIIMTSNVGARLITDKQTAFGFADSSEEGERNDAKIKEAVMGELRNTFRPEFLNRVDDIIVFHRLTKPQIKEIASRLLGNLQKRIESMDIHVSFTDDAVEKIADAGFDEVYGARPLKRAIQSRIEDELSEAMLRGEVKAQHSYTCRVAGDGFVFTEDGALPETTGSTKAAEPPEKNEG
ncbi:MAG TPA: ATP-dependent Clp protease ATP-binding subunit [Candidatus Fimenecus stercoravium]|nr:ATP-dependent Clp protease ATP-binding subunit [Candidatus Fimenecus stercoravium]